MLDEAEQTLWSPVDAVLTPTVPVVSPPCIAELEADDEAFARANALILRNPSAFNFLDACTAVGALPPTRHGAGRADAGRRPASRRCFVGGDSLSLPG